MYSTYALAMHTGILQFFFVYTLGTVFNVVDHVFDEC